MPAITLPDGSVRRFDAPVTGTTVAEAIGPGLARAALAMKLDGKLVDLAAEIDRDAQVVFVTRRDPDALELIRHDAAHVLAEAVQELYPGTQVTIGPAIENGFYYDFARNEPFTPEDFPAIEAKMREIVARGAPVRAIRDGPRGRDPLLPGQGREVQGRADPGPAARRDDQPLYPGRLGRSLPRPAHAQHRRCRPGLQADEDGRCLLARRPPQRHAVPHLRHRLARPEGARRLPAPARGSRTPRPPPHRQGNGPVPPPGGSRPARCSGIRTAGSSIARPKPTCAAAWTPPATRRCARPLLARPRLVGAVRPLGEFPPEHVLRHGGATRTRSSR